MSTWMGLHNNFLYSICSLVLKVTGRWALEVPTCLASQLSYLYVDDIGLELGLGFEQHLTWEDLYDVVVVLVGALTVYLTSFR